MGILKAFLDIAPCLFMLFILFTVVRWVLTWLILRSEKK